MERVVDPLQQMNIDAISRKLELPGGSGED